MSKTDQIADLTARVERLERRRRQDEHVHNWRYQVTAYADDGYRFYSWTCRDADGEPSKDCESPSAGTNARTHVPDHFPRSLL